jgi:DNA-directed RNA polymerase specialized sigma24 family protein
LLDSELNVVFDDVRESDRDAFGKTLHVYGRSLRSSIAAQVHALEDIDDLAQDALVVYNTLQKFADFRERDDFGAGLEWIAL